MKPCFLWIITHTPMIPVVPVCLYILCSPVIFCSPGRSQNQPIFSVPWVHKTVLLLLSDITWMRALHPTVPSSLELSFAGFLQTLAPCHLACLEATEENMRQSKPQHHNFTDDLAGGSGAAGWFWTWVKEMYCWQKKGGKGKAHPVSSHFVSISEVECKICNRDYNWRDN